MKDFATYESSSQIKNMCKQLKQDRGTKTGEALEHYYKMFEAVKGKAGLKMILFLFVRGNTKGSQSLLQEYGNKYRSLGDYLIFNLYL